MINDEYLFMQRDLIVTVFFTVTDGGGSQQQRRFCTAKTRVQKLTRRSIFELTTDGDCSMQ